MANFTYEAITYAIDEGDGKAINDETALGIVGSVAVLLAVAIGASVYVAVMSLKRVSTRE